MAIDTKEKRASALGVGRPWMRGQFPVATPDEEWRISVGNAYGGNVLFLALPIVRDFIKVLAQPDITLLGQSDIACPGEADIAVPVDAAIGV